MLIYVTNPAIAKRLGKPLGFVTVPPDVGAELLKGRNAYRLDHAGALPAIGYVDAGAAPYPAPPPPPPPPPPQAMPSRRPPG